MWNGSCARLYSYIVYSLEHFVPLLEPPDPLGAETKDDCYWKLITFLPLKSTLSKINKWSVGFEALTAAVMNVDIVWGIGPNVWTTRRYIPEDSSIKNGPVLLTGLNWKNNV
jgi:hypothetical protein